MTESYHIELSKPAAKQLSKLDRQAQRRIQAALTLLAAAPRPPGAKKLVGENGVWRVRTGNYRVLYEVFDQRLVILVIRVGHRRDIYDHE